MGKQHILVPLMGLTGLLAAACTGETRVDPDDTGDDPDDLAGNIIVEPCVIDFGELLPGETASELISARNTGQGELQITEITLDAPFETEADPPLTVGVGGTYQFTVRFRPGPSDFGVSSGELVVGSDDPQEPSIVCTLSGSVVADADGDGFDSIEAGGADCDDQDPLINPAAEEQWYNGIDEDCDGASDFDQDGDGYDSVVHWEDPENPNPETGQPGGDCQDVNPTMNPGEEEVWYDGKDADCDGQNDFDRDGDGWRTAEFGYEDCDDDDPLANPTGTEAFNGKDDDCNGLVDDRADPERADRVAYGGDEDFSAGRSVAIADFDENGVAEVVVGVHYALFSGTTTGGDAQGGIAIFFDGGITDEDFVGDESDEDVWVGGVNADEEMGFETISLPDFSGNGAPDLATTSVSFNSYRGRVHLFRGGVGGDISSTMDYEDAALTITGLAGYALGGGLGTGDLDGDGFSELVMFGTDRSRLKTYTAVHYGSSMALGDINWTEIDATFENECGTRPSSSWFTPACEGEGFSSWGSAGGDAGGHDSFLNNGHAAADFDGDGYDDVVLGDLFSEGGGARDRGQAWVLWGRRAEYGNSNSEYSDTMTILANGSGENAQLGAVAPVPDIDGDGADEVMVHDDGTGSIYLLMGGPELRSDGRDLEEVSAAIFRGSGPWTGSVNAGDWTGDGVDDVGLAYADGNTFLLFESREYSGEYQAETDAYGSILGSDWNDAFGRGLPISTDDISGDGLPDLVMGDPEYDNEDLSEPDDTEGGIFVFIQGGDTE